MSKLYKLLFLVLFVVSSFFAFAQDKLLTLKDVVWMNPEIYPPSLQKLQWMGKSDNFVFIANNNLVKGKATSEKRDTILSINELNTELVKLNADSIKKFPSITFINDNIFIFNKKGKLFSFDLIAEKLQLLNEYDKKAKNIDIDKNTFSIAYTKDNNLFIAVNGQEILVTNDKDKEIVNGKAVHRVEFGIKKGTFWSPEGNLLAFYRKDETMVTDYPLVNINKRIAEVENTKYPMAGMKSHHVTLGIFNPLTKQTVFIKTGEPAEQYLTNISWSPNEKYIYIVVLNRDQNHLKLNQYDVITGEFVKTLFEEKDEKYVEPEHGLYFLKTNPGQFIWFSERDGYNHLYLYDTDGNLIKQLTKGKWVVTDFLGFDEKDKTAFFISTKESPIEKNIYSVDLKNLEITRLSPDKGTHKAKINGNGKYIIDIYSSTKIAKEYKLLDTKAKVVQILLEDKDPLKDYNLGEMSIFTIKADDNTELYCRLIKPIDFDPKKKYPVFIYVYGGPHAQLITDSWLGDAGLFLNYMAEQGYVVFTLDNRGSANRGLDFEQAIFRNVGTFEVNDQMKGVEYLKSLDFVDTERLGVDGWSYGGFMTISMMLKKPGVFKVGCAGGPVIDWKYYEVMYGERYMDTPENNQEGYENASLLNYVDKLKGKLLIIHGTSDPTVVWQNSLNFIKKCVDEGIQVDYFVYPGHPHNVRGKDRMHLYKKIETYFKDYLK
ncbi:MAG: S9 family peptidase [Bacteroidales bacterium]|nr:S9 family peptidase [Bacteroidales bacterium]